MENVLGTLFGNIADAIRSKTGDMGTMKPVEFASKIEAIEVGASNKIKYLPTTKLAFEYQNAFGVYGQMVAIDEATYTAWTNNTKPVIVVYDGVEHTCAVQKLGGEITGVGNLTPLDGSSNGEEFAVIALREEGDIGTSYVFLVGSLVDTVPAEHSIYIYQETNSGGGSGGASGELTTIAGTFTTGTETTHTVTHNSGKVPIFAWVYSTYGFATHDTMNVLNLAIGFGSAVANTIKNSYHMYYYVSMKQQMQSGSTKTIDDTSTERAINNATDKAITFGGANSPLRPNTHYTYVIIG